MRILITGRGPTVAEAVVQLALDLRKQAKVAVLYTHDEEYALLRAHRIPGYHMRSIGHCGQARLNKIWAKISAAELENMRYQGVNLWQASEYERLRFKPPAGYLKRMMSNVLRDLLALEAVLGDFRPDVLVTWNGVPVEMKMTLQLARQAGTATFCMERGLFPDSLVIDPLGVNARSILCTDHWKTIADSQPSDQAVAQLRTYLDHIHAKQRSVVRQGRSVTAQTLRAELDLSKEHRLILVPEQLDWDTNVIYNAPDYPTNEDALRAILKGCMSMDPYAVLFKPHPENPRPGDAIGVLGSRGYSVGGYNIHSLIRAADLVVVRNSTVGLEAASHDKPVVVLGKAVWSHKGFTFDVASPEHLHDTFQEALARGFTPAMRQAADRFLVYISHNSHYYLRKAAPFDGVNERMVRQLLAAKPTTAVAYTGRGPLARAIGRSARRRWAKHLLRRSGIVQQAAHFARKSSDVILGPLLQQQLKTMKAQLRDEMRQDVRRELRGEIQPLQNSIGRLQAKLDILHNDHHGMKHGDRQVAPTVEMIRDDHLNRYRAAMEFIASDGFILDLGCGIGYGTYMMAEKAADGKAIGLDISEEAIAYAKRHYARPNVEYRVDDCMTTDFGDRRFDLIACFEVLEHLPDPERLMALAARWLKPNGCLICSTPNQEVVPFDGKQFPYHHQHYTVEQLGELTRATDLKLEQMLFQNRHVNFQLDPQGEKYFLIAVCRKSAVSAAAA